jgi:hypothetical protein
MSRDKRGTYEHISIYLKIELIFKNAESARAYTGPGADFPTCRVVPVSQARQVAIAQAVSPSRRSMKLIGR